ncbi:MAG: hypothetical protein J5892_03065 [Bacilli bacterium]|nr:hypothetical protein [Bacilli bacterium]
MEVIINDNKFELEDSNIYGLIMEDKLTGNDHTLINASYYDDVSLSGDDELKLASLIGVVDGNSFTNNKRKLLVKILCKKYDYIILENFFTNFTYIDSNAFIKLFRNITKKYHKVIIIKEKNMDFLLNNCDYLLNYHNQSLVSKSDYYLMDYLNFDKPSIYEFTNLIIDKNIKIKYYANRLDLLKSLYRLVM